MSAKSTIEEIRQRFDQEVDRFSNLETGQAATIDAPLVLELITHAAATTTPHARHVLDVGCGAGNYTLKLLQRLPDLDATLIDLSQAMLDRAVSRLRPATHGTLTALQGDMRQLDLGEQRYDIILAAAVLHHLRTDAEWEAVFAKFHAALRPGGSIWISDLIEHADPGIQAMMWSRYGDYLLNLKGGGEAGELYRSTVFGYLAHEDTPKPLMYQLDLLRQVGFADVDVLHKNSVFAAFGGRREGPRR
ncbi:MAG TPA: class I SAM-dependent methyltransferase [Tepidisphaeraceae bacterium]|nr:class I SAM-dependent methyltransferase [Tepidisphaeraceae bacterium]